MHLRSRTVHEQPFTNEVLFLPDTVTSLWMTWIRQIPYRPNRVIDIAARDGRRSSAKVPRRVTCLSVCQPSNPCVRLFVSTPARPPTDLSDRPSLRPSAHPPIRPFAHAPAKTSTRQNQGPQLQGSGSRVSSEPKYRGDESLVALPTKTFTQTSVRPEPSVRPPPLHHEVLLSPLRIKIIRKLSIDATQYYSLSPPPPLHHEVLHPGGQALRLGLRSG